jgi:hypothetical protein
MAKLKETAETITAFSLSSSTSKVQTGIIKQNKLTVKIIKATRNH